MSLSTIYSSTTSVKIDSSSLSMTQVSSSTLPSDTYGVYVSTNLNFYSVPNTTLSCDTGYQLSSSSHVRGLACSSNGTIVHACIGTGKIYKSIDSGNTFSELTNSPNVTNANIWRSMSCSSDGSIVVACKSTGFISVSTNSGITWISGVSGVPGTAVSKGWNSVSMSDDGTKLLAGESFVWTGAISK